MGFGGRPGGTTGGASGSGTSTGVGGVPGGLTGEGGTPCVNTFDFPGRAQAVAQILSRHVAIDPANPAILINAIFAH